MQVVITAIGDVSSGKTHILKELKTFLEGKGYTVHTPITEDIASERLIMEN